MAHLLTPEPGLLWFSRRQSRGTKTARKPCPCSPQDELFITAEQRNTPRKSHCYFSNEVAIGLMKVPDMQTTLSGQGSNRKRQAAVWGFVRFLFVPGMPFRASPGLSSSASHTSHPHPQLSRLVALHMQVRSGD